VQGTNADEGRFPVGFELDAVGKPLTAAEYPGVVQLLYGASLAPRILARYPLSAYPSPDLALASLATDEEFSCPALQADDLLASSGAYGYEFADPNPPNPFGTTFTFPIGAMHSTEIEYLLQTLPNIGVKSRPYNITPSFTAAQFVLSNQMMGYWARFAATGNPNGDGAPRWPAFTSAHHEIQELIPSRTSAETNFAAEHQCAFWESAGL
jgi:para-nitrobenzyl esterase